MTLAVAHRGAPLLAVENTLPSIDTAIKAGADWVKIDVKLTRDDVPVLLHDNHLHRIWGQMKAVREVPLAKLPEGIPTLRSALDLIHGRGIRLLIDVIGVPEALASLDAVTEPGEVAFTGDVDALAAIRERDQDAIFTMTWVDRELPGEDVFDRVRPQYFNQDHERLNADTIKAMHARGLLVATYTVDNPDRMRWLADNGVDAITSNDITTLASLLRTAHA
jgi:glycerophosphoryl diester phosphodiesterase